MTLRTSLITLAFVFLCSCSKKHPQNLIAPGSPMADSMQFEYAVYVLPASSKEPLSVLRQLLAKKYPGLKLVDELPKQSRETVVHVRVEKDVQGKYSPPEMGSMKHFSKGVSTEQAQAVQKAPEVLILDFSHPKDKVWSGLQNADSLVEEIARQTGGLIWDNETRELFPPDVWHKNRLESWTSELPDISEQTIVHLYPNGEYVRAISLGMAKVGLPDVVVEELPASSQNQIGNLINLFCQSMVEGAYFDKPARFKLDLHSIRNASLREPLVKSLGAKANGKACLSLKKGTWEEGDPKNRLIELTFDQYPGPDRYAKEDAMITALFGAEDLMRTVKHTDELLKASRKAKSKLPELHKAFSAGLEPGEFIQVKAPFKIDDGGNEWMWVEVTSWNGSYIKGLLANEPSGVRNLHDGQVVEVREEDIFDYIRQYPDKHREGNSTGEILRKMDEQERGATNSTPTPVEPVTTACDSNP